MSILTYKPPKWVVVLMLTLVGLLIVALYRGCKQSFNKKAAKIEILEEQLRYNDSIGKENKHQYDGVLEYQNGILSLRENQLISANDSVDKLNTQITALLKKYKAITPSVDTTVTMVPNEYIENCADCFILLDKSKEATKRQMTEQGHLASAYKDKINTQGKRITQLGSENAQLKDNLNSAIDIAKENQKKYEPRRKVLLSMSAIAINANYPTGVGAGLIYQDKLNRLYGGHVFGTNVGPVYMAQFALPLSLRRQK